MLDDVATCLVLLSQDLNCNQILTNIHFHIQYITSQSFALAEIHAVSLFSVPIKVIDRTKAVTQQFYENSFKKL